MDKISTAARVALWPTSQRPGLLTSTAVPPCTAVMGESRGILDEAYERLHATGPELISGLTNHGPMVVECLTHLGHDRAVHQWVDAYAGELDELPRGRDVDDWAAALGVSSRLGDWLEHFSRDDRPWEELLALWWPRLLPGMAAAATHGVIRTGHAVRALRCGQTPPRRAELGQALAYWAALWQPIPDLVPTGMRSAREALPAVPTLAVQEGRAFERLGRLDETPGWAEAVRALRPTSAGAAAALDEVIDAAVRTYAGRAWGEPIMLVHAVTAPAAVALVLPSLPPELHEPSVRAAWTTTAALVSSYAGPTPRPARTPAPSVEEAVEQAVRHGDAHVVKLTEAALRAPDRRAGLQAAAAAVSLVV